MMKRTVRSISLVEAVCYHHMYRNFHVSRNPFKDMRSDEIENTVKPSLYKSFDNFIEKTKHTLANSTELTSRLSSMRDSLQNMSSNITDRISSIAQKEQVSSTAIDTVKKEEQPKIEGQTTPIAEQIDTNATRSLFGQFFRIFPDAKSPPSLLDSLFRPFIIITAVMLGCWFYCLHETGFTDANFLHDIRAKMILVTTGLYLLLQRISVLKIIRSIFSPKRLSAVVLFLTRGIVNTGISAITNLMSVIPKNMRDSFIKMTKSKNPVENVIGLSQQTKLLLGGLLIVWYLVGGGMNGSNDPFVKLDAQVQNGIFKQNVERQNQFWYTSLYQVFLKQAVEVWVLTLPFFVMAVRESEHAALPGRGMLFASRLASSIGVACFLGGMGLQFAHRVQKQLFDTKNEDYQDSESFFYIVNKYKIQFGEELVWMSFALVSIACLLAKRQTLLVQTFGTAASLSAPALMWKKISDDQMEERDKKQILTSLKYDAILFGNFISELVRSLYKLIADQVSK